MQYEGETQNGEGKITLVNGSAYEGSFVNGYLVHGTYTGRTGTKTSYTGSFISEWKPVDGILFRNGRKFIVSFREDCDAIASCIDSFIQAGCECKYIKNIMPLDDDDKQSSEAPAARRQTPPPYRPPPCPRPTGSYLQSSHSREVCVTKQSPGQSKVFQDNSDKRRDKTMEDILALSFDKTRRGKIRLLPAKSEDPLTSESKDVEDEIRMDRVDRVKNQELEGEKPGFHPMDRVGNQELESRVIQDKGEEFIKSLDRSKQERQRDEQEEEKWRREEVEAATSSNYSDEFEQDEPITPMESERNEEIKSIQERRQEVESFKKKVIDEVECDINRASIDKSRKLGSGSFADVVGGTYRFPGDKNATHVAFKIFREAQDLTKKMLEKIEAEVALGMRCNHENLVRLCGVVNHDSDGPCLVLELCEGGSLRSALDRVDAGDITLGWMTRVSWLRDIAKGMKFLHDLKPKSIVHRNLKAANVLLSSSDFDSASAKVADFGVSTTMSETIKTPRSISMSWQESSAGGVDTLAWMAPETFDDKYSEKSDSYAFGMVTYEVVTNKVPHFDKTRAAIIIAASKRMEEKGFTSAEQEQDWLYKHPLKDRRPDLGHVQPDCPPHLKDLMQECWSDQPGKRPTFLEIVDSKLKDNSQERRMLRLDQQRELDALRHKFWRGSELERKLREQAAELTALREREREAQARREREDKDRTDRLRQCFVCFDEVDVDAGVECRTGHFMCAVCLNEEVKTQVYWENIGAFKKAKLRIKCRHPECSGDSWLDRALTRHLAEDVFHAYLGAREAVLLGEALQEQEERYNKKVRDLEEQMQKLAAGRDRAVMQARKNIIENILTLKCPRLNCRRAFVDFDGCFALTCCACASEFCAYCLQDCGRQAHRHVASCQYNIAPGKSVFASIQLFEGSQRERRTRLLKEYLAQHVEAGVRGALIEAMERDLADLGIDGAHLLCSQ